MKHRVILLIVFLIFSCKQEEKDKLIYPEEVNFKSIKQITFGGDNAEAYWSFDNKQIIFQSSNKNWDVNCDQMFIMNKNETFDSNIPKMVSTGKGRTTCSYFLPDNIMTRQN